MTNDPKVAIEEVLNSFKRQHNAEEGELSHYIKPCYHTYQNHTTGHNDATYNAPRSPSGNWMRCCTN